MRAAPSSSSASRRFHRNRAAAAPTNIYAHDGANALAPAARNVAPRVYVPNSGSNTVDVIDQRTFKIVARYRVGALPQHVTPSYDLKTLWVDNDAGNSLTPVSPVTGRPKGRPVPVTDPYNLYFTPGGRFAIVVAEREHQLDFRFAHSMRLHRALSVPCRGVDHMDFSADGRFLLASCEFSAELVKVDVRRERVVGTVQLPRAGAMPQDVKLSPNGRVFYVADMASNGVWRIDGTGRHVLGLIHTGAGAHGFVPEPEREAALRHEPQRGNDLRPRLRHRQGRRQVEGRRQPRHGRRLGGRQGAVAVGSLRRAALRDQHQERPGSRPDPGRIRPTRRLRVAAAGPLLARPHGHTPLGARSRRRVAG